MFVSNKKESIINATLSVVSKNGLVSSPVSKVAAEAGVSVGLIYRYFRSKDELIFTLYRDIMNDLDLFFKEKLNDKSIKKQLKKRWENSYNYLFENPLKADFIIEYRTLSRVKDEGVELDEMKNFFSKTKVKTELKKFELDLFIELFLSSLFSAYLLTKSKEMYTKSFIFNDVYSYFWDGIKR